MSLSRRRASRGIRSFSPACHYGDFECFSLAAGWVGLSRRSDYAGIQKRAARSDLQSPAHALRSSDRAARWWDREALQSAAARRLGRDSGRSRLAPASADAWRSTVLGMKTSVTFAHAWLASRTGLPIVPGACRSRSRAVAAGSSFIPTLEIPAGRDRSGDRATLLGPFEPVVRQNPVALALDVQILALPARRMRRGPIRITPIPCRVSTI